MNIEQQISRQIGALCSLPGYNRQACCQSRRAIEQEALQHELIIRQVFIPAALRSAGMAPLNQFRKAWATITT